MVIIIIYGSMFKLTTFRGRGKKSLWNKILLFSINQYTPNPAQLGLCNQNTGGKDVIIFPEDDRSILGNVEFSTTGSFQNRHYSTRFRYGATSPNLISETRARRSRGDRSFCVAAPRVWNTLPREIATATSLQCLKTGLKTYLFKRSY